MGFRVWGLGVGGFGDSRMSMGSRHKNAEGIVRGWSGK